MSADLLRRAAAAMRERAEAAPMAPWWPTNRGYVVHPLSPTSSIRDTVAEVLPYGDNDQRVQNATYIASWHPAVALAVADSLDQAAAIIDEAESGPLAMAMNAISEPLVTVARAYLGESA